MALIPMVYLLANSSTSVLKKKDAEFVREYLLVAGMRSLFRDTTETTVDGYVRAIRTVTGDRTKGARALLEKIPKNRLYKIKKEDVRATSGMYVGGGEKWGQSGG